MPKTRQALKWYRAVVTETFLEAIKWHFPTNIFPWNCDRFLKGALLRKCPPITYLLNELVDYVWVSLVSLGLWKSLSINILKFWEEETNGINKSVSCEITSLRVHQTLTNQTNCYSPSPFQQWCAVKQIQMKEEFIWLKKINWDNTQ